MWTLTGFREHILSAIKPYMCTYDACPSPKQSYRSKHEWIAHQNSHHASSTNITATCPFCIKQLESYDNNFYSHVGDHMEKIRLFSLPPSHRQSVGINHNYQGLDDRSDTEIARGTLPTGGAHDAVAEEESPGAAPGILEQYLSTCDQLNKEQLLEIWFTNVEAAYEPRRIRTSDDLLLECRSMNTPAPPRYGNLDLMFLTSEIR